MVADIMHREAPNVAMCWCPNDYPIGDEHPYYPGDQYVDWVGVSSYPPYKANGAPTQGNTWIDRFREIYDSYGSKKPIYITEGAALPNVEGSQAVTLAGTAAYEIQRFYAGAARRYPNLKMIVYWSKNEEKDRWVHGQITDVPEVLAAYKSAVADPYYLSNTVNGGVSDIYYEKVSNVKLKTGVERISAYANDVNNWIHHVAYYVNGEYVAQADFPTFEVDIDFSKWAGQEVTLKADFCGHDGRTVQSVNKTVSIGDVKPLTIYYNGQKVDTPEPPFIYNDRTYLPVRYVGEAVRSKVDWDNDTRTVIVNRDNINLLFRPDDTTFIKNGVKNTAVAPVIIRNSRSFAPVRSIAEGLDLNIDWVASERSVYISDK